MNEDYKKITNKNAVISQKCCAFWVFTNDMECERFKQDFSNKVFVLKATSVLIFEYKNSRKTNFKKYYTIGLLFNYYKGKSVKEFADMFFLKTRSVYNIISQAEKEELDLKGSTIRPTKVMQRVERKITKTVYDSPQSCTRGLTLQVEKDIGLRVFHEIIRNILEKHQYSSRVARKKSLLSVQNIEKRIRFTSSGVLG